jgi:thioredoxin 1
MKNVHVFLLILSSVLISITACKQGSDDGIIITFTTDNFSSETAKGIVLVDFWATWCMPCKAMAPVIDEIATQTKGKVKVGKLDIDSNGPIANQFGIQAIPTIIIFKDGQVVEQLVGLKSKTEVMNTLSKYVTLQ